MSFFMRDGAVMSCVTENAGKIKPFLVCTEKWQMKLCTRNHFRAGVELFLSFKCYTHNDVKFQLADAAHFEHVIAVHWNNDKKYIDEITKIEHNGCFIMRDFLP